MNSSIIKTFRTSLDFSNAYVATGYNFPDALSGGALAALNNNPIVLTSADVEQETKEIIRNNNIKKITILGGTTVISDATANKLNTQTSNGDVDENTHVWIANTSSTVYHDSSECSNMKNPIKNFLKDARLLELNPCSKCNPPR